MGRRTSQSLVVALARGRQQRQREAEKDLRRKRREQDEADQAHRRAMRELAKQNQEAMVRYRSYAEQQAARRTDLLEARVAELDDVLFSGLRRGPAPIETLRRQFTPPPMAPGPLGIPIQPPHLAQYEVEKQGGLVGMTPKARREREAAEAQAKAAFDRDTRVAWEAEQRRRADLAQYQSQFNAWVTNQQAEASAHNTAVDDLVRRYATGDHEAIADNFAMMLEASDPWPEGFPRNVLTEWNAYDSWQLPSVTVIPEISRVKYVRASDREGVATRPAAEVRERYRRLIAWCALRVAVEVFSVDVPRHVGSIALSGFVVHTDPATGEDRESWLVAVVLDRPQLERTTLTKIDPVAYVEAVGGRISEKPDKVRPVQPVRLPAAEEGRSGQRDPSTALADLLVMDPIELERLVCRLFEALGLEATTTKWTGDGGIDIDAFDPNPIMGGHVVVQVKRYTATVTPSAVRDLYGTVLHTRAMKGILVTTSGFGPESRAFVRDKPLTLIHGSQLVELLQAHGLLDEPRKEHL